MLTTKPGLLHFVVLVTAGSALKPGCVLLPLKGQRCRTTLRLFNEER